MVDSFLLMVVLMQVEVAELDPVVIAAATDAMGFPTSR